MKYLSRIKISLLFMLPLMGCSAPAPTEEKPNILLIVVDDLGFSDLGVFGSEIKTPNIDKLAQEGILLTNFNASPSCSPTRAMLLSGVTSHRAGLGSMAEDMAENQRGKPGYEGFLNQSVAAMPEIFKSAGYRTYMTGKWHLGLEKTQLPSSRGFERSFAMLQGGAGQFSNMLPLIGPGKARYSSDGEYVDQLPNNFYGTVFYTEHLIKYLREGADSKKPFFAYLAYTAPHWPLQAPRESIERYQGVYDEGYDVLRHTRFERAKALGYFSEDVKEYPKLEGVPAWEDLSKDEQRYASKVMSVYAAMIDDVDRNIGELISYLKETGQYDNTIIIFMSDNGPEAHELNNGWPALDEWSKSCCDNSYENIGAENSYVWQGLGWGQAGNPPLRMFKGAVSQGGVNVPAFVHFPSRFAGGVRNDSVISVMDILPTLLDVAKVDYPGDGEFNGRPAEAMQGISILPILKEEAHSVRDDDDFIAWELFGKRAVRKGRYKAVYTPYHRILADMMPIGKFDEWQLFDLEEDPSESNNLASELPDKLHELVTDWQTYADENGVILPDKAIGY